MLFRLFSILFLAIASFSGLSQRGNAGSPVPVTKMVIKRWTGVDGLISNNLTSVNQTDDGFIWITTFNGIHRFDGVDFKLFDKGNVTSLKTNAFYSVTNDSLGVILSSQGSGLLRYKDGLITSISEFEMASVRNVLVDSKERYWCGTNNEGVFLKDGGKPARVDYELFDQVVILHIYEDSSGRVWFATEGNGLILFEEGIYRRYKAQNLTEHNIVTKILETRTGKILVGTTSGAYFLDEQNNAAQLLNGFDNIYINDVVEDSTGMLWLAAESGLYRTHPETGYFEHYDVEKGLPSNQVSSALIDHEGSVWLTTKKSGLMKISTGSVVTLGARDGITSTKVNIVVQDEGKTYIGSDDGSIFIKEGDEVRTLNLSPKQKQVGIRDFLIEDDAIWVASYLGLHKFANGREEVINTDDGLSSNLIRRVLKRSDGSKWLASRSGGIMKLENDRVTNIYNTNNGLKSNFILALAEDREGNIVAGTHSGGISIISDDTVQTYLPEVKGVVIFNVYVDDMNRYWISSSIGVFVFESGFYRKLEFDVPFKIEAIFDFVPDQQGNAWLSTNTGIIQVPKDQMSLFSEGLTDVITARIFDSNDGMANKECTGATRSTLMSDGRVMIPTLDGVAIVDPSIIQTNQKVPEIAITSFIVDEQLVSPEEGGIAPGRLRYEFEFTSSSYMAPDHVRFKYRLSGVDDDWILTSDRKIEYTNLGPGTYTFSVIGSNNNGLWNEEGAARTFVVKPFYYQTNLFRILCALLVLLVFYFIFIWRVRRVKAVNEELSKVNKELDRFVYSASHDIRAPLTSILGAVNIAKDSETLEEKDHYLEMIQTSAGKLDGFIRDIIDYSRNQRLELVAEKVDLKAELDGILDSLKYINEATTIKCNIGDHPTDFVTDVRRLRVILKNIIANAFFYADPDKKEHYVTIHCRYKSGKLEIMITDNGLGMKKEVIKNIFDMFFRANTDSKGSGLGLYIAKENAEKLGGSIQVDSKEGKGTTFTVRIPELEIETD